MPTVKSKSKSRVRKSPLVSAFARKWVPEVKRAILAQPEAYDQSDAGMRRIMNREAQHSCKSPACIIGWAIYLIGQQLAPKEREQLEEAYTDIRYATSISPLARKTMQITEKQFWALYCYEYWPKKFHTEKNPSPKIAAQRLDHFLRTGK